MKKFSQFLQEQLLNEAPPGPAPGGLAGPAGLPPGGPPPGGLGGPPGGGLPPMPPLGGLGAPPPTMGGPGGMPGAPGAGGPAMKLKSPDVWEVLEKVLGVSDKK
jgi:hypothetical protein